ncbi:MAG TPA: hypothetical protein VJA25_03125 [Dehalococcoidia bacterium]|nr:hypothetical protein [Dehalococcoidia bacterium]HLE80265.1 hypothetical protein [Dehalococcoidia bacterium]
MVGWPFRARTVRRSELFEQNVSLIHPHAPRLDEQLRGVEWAVATNPEAFPTIPGTSLRLVKTDPFPGAPPLRVYFTIDDENTCTLQYVELIEAPAAEEDFSI